MPPRGEEKSRWRPPVPSSNTTVTGALYGQADTLDSDTNAGDFIINLAVPVAHSPSKLKTAIEALQDLKKAGLNRPKPRPVETRPYKAYGDVLARNAIGVRAIRTNLCEGIAQLTANKPILEPTDGLTLLADTLTKVRSVTEAKDLIDAPKLNISGKDLARMEELTQFLLKEIENGDKLASSIGNSFNQLLLWANQNQDLAFLSFRAIDGVAASLSQNGKIPFGAGTIDLVAIKLAPDSPYTPQEIEEIVFEADRSTKRLTKAAVVDLFTAVTRFATKHLTREMAEALGLTEDDYYIIEILQKGNLTDIEKFQHLPAVNALAHVLPLQEYGIPGAENPELAKHRRKSGMSVQELVLLPALYTLLREQGALLYLIDFKQRTSPPNAQVIETEIVQLQKYKHAIAPERAVRSNNPITVHGDRERNRRLHLLADSIRLQILELEQDRFYIRDVEVPGEEAGPITQGKMHGYYKEVDAHRARKRTARIMAAPEQGVLEGFVPIDKGTPTEKPFIAEFISPEDFKWEDVVVKMRERHPQRVPESTELLVQLIDDIRGEFRRLLDEGVVKKNDLALFNIVENFYRELSQVTTYQQLHPLLERLQKTKALKVPWLNGTIANINELHLRYFEVLEGKEKYPELATLRSILETTAMTGKIPLYDFLILIYHDIEDDDPVHGVKKLMKQHPDGTITIDVILPNYPHKVVIAIPKYSEHAYFFIPKNPDDYSPELRKHGGPPYIPLAKDLNNHGKVHILQRDGQHIEPIHLVSQLRRSYDFIEPENFPFLTGELLSRPVLTELLHKLHEWLPKEGPQLAQLLAMGIPSDLAQNELGLRFTPPTTGVDHLIQHLIALGLTDEELIQLGLTLGNASVFGAVLPSIKPNRTIFPLTSIAPTRDEQGTKHVSAVGFSHQALKKDDNPRDSTMHTWIPPAIAQTPAHGYYQVGDLTKARHVCIIGDQLDAATMLVMFNSVGLDTSKICFLSPVGSGAYAQIAEDIKVMRHNFGQIEKVHVLRGKYDQETLLHTLKDHKLDHELSTRRVVTDFWDVVHSAAVLTMPASRSMSVKHGRVSKLWRRIIEITHANITPEGVVFPSPAMEERARNFITTLYNALF